MKNWFNGRRSKKDRLVFVVPAYLDINPNGEGTSVGANDLSGNMVSKIPAENQSLLWGVITHFSSPKRGRLTF
jgi:hypothetical protein